MTLPLPGGRISGPWDAEQPKVQQKFDALAQTFPLGTQHLQDDAVTTGKIADAAVTAVKIETQQAWQAATFQNSWVNFDGAATDADGGYYKDSLGRVWIKGRVKNGTLGLAVFTLPAGYRPSENHYFATVFAGNTHGLILVQTDGAVIVNGATNTDCNLTCSIRAA
jgi:hypothetical protein